MKKVVVALGLFALLTGCGDGPTEPSPTTVTSIVVTAQSPSLQVGATMTASARLMNSKGDEVAGKTATWSSSATNIATVDQNGIVTAVAPGVATITAAVGSVKGTFPLTVDVDRCVNALSLDVGQMTVLSGPTAVSCITLGASQSASQLLFIAANANSVTDAIGAFTISLQNGTAASASSPEALFGGRLSAEMRQVTQSLVERDAIETHIRQAEGRIVRAIPPRPVAASLGEESAQRPKASVLALATAVGDTITYRVPNVLVTELCKNYTTIRAVIKAIGKKSQIAQDVTAASTFTTSDFTAIAAEFDNLIFKTDTSWFGAPTDINKDGRITILYTPEVNKFTKKGSSSYIGGFFWGGDLFTKEDYARAQPEPIQCPQTNEQEIFYLLAADPSGAFGDPRSTALVRQATRGTIAHEFQHMINQGIRQFNQGEDPFEVDWMNEGLSHFAEEAVGRASRGFTDFQSLTGAEVRANADDYAAYFQQNLGRFASYLSRPDTTSPTSKSAATELPARGAAWALLRYTADQFAPSNARQFFKRLVAGPSSSVTNLVQRAGAPFDQILSGWLVANYTDNLNIAGLDPRFSYTSWNMRDAIAGAAGGNYPLRVNTPGAPTTFSRVVSGSGAYFLAQRAAGAPVATFRMLDPGGGNVTFAGARVYVVRVN
jgi:hypothetical protein